MHQKKMTRRFFLASSAAVALSGCASGGRKSLGKMGYKSPNEKLNVAAIGAGGKGGGDIDACKGENVIALCDADWRRAGGTFDKFENAKQYKDFRVMLDKHGDELDACTISTPDHIHAPAAMACIRNGIGVYVQKPLTHSIMEARALRKAAKKYKVATQMGNQGHSGDGVRRLCEMVWGGAIGQIREVHAWTNRPIWPQGMHTVLPAQPIPETLDWDLWLGPAPYRQYNEGYAPFKWRGWWDYGCGALGDMACHIMDPANWALRLGAPDSVECVYQEGMNTLTAPNKSVIRYDFPARGKQQKADSCGCRSMDVMAPVTFYWYDGGIMPPRPTDIPEGVKLGDGSNGSLFIGEKGYITTGCYGGETRLLPEELNNDYTRPDPYIPRSPGNDHHRDWLRACKGGPEACSNFKYSGPFTEVVLLGNLSLRVPGKLLWNQERTKYEQEEFIGREYRKGWTL